MMRSSNVEDRTSNVAYQGVLMTRTSCSSCKASAHDQKLTATRKMEKRLEVKDNHR